MAGKKRALPAMRGRTLWLAGGFLGLGLIWPEISSCVGRVLPGSRVADGEGSNPGGEEDEGHWQVIARADKQIDALPLCGVSD